MSYLFGKPLAYRRRATGIVGDENAPMQNEENTKLILSGTAYHDIFLLIFEDNVFKYYGLLSLLKVVCRISSS